MAESYNLKSAVPVFGNKARSPNTLFVFQSEGTYYLWNVVQDSVWKIVEPTGKDEIKRKIWGGDMKSLNMERVPESA